jgi:hypothetical protein
MVKEFSSIIALNTFNDAMKLSFDISKKALQGRRGVGFVFQSKSPRIVRVIIENNQIIFITKKTCNRGGPEITVNELKGRCGKTKGRRKRKSRLPT